MSRFFVEMPDDRAPTVGQRLVLDRDESRHVVTVLRGEPGALVALTDGRGHALSARLLRSERGACTVEVVAVEAAPQETTPPLLHLACAVVKGRRFETALEKAVELGVHTITPLVCERGVVNPRDGRRDRWRHVLIAALKQCDRCYLPQVEPLADPATLLGRAPQGLACVAAAPAETAAGERLTLDRIAAAATGGVEPSQLLLLVGPEGGFTADEQRLLAARGVLPLDLGPHVLRSETAAVAGLAVLQQLRRRLLAARQA